MNNADYIHLLSKDGDKNDITMFYDGKEIGRLQSIKATVSNRNSNVYTMGSLMQDLRRDMYEVNTRTTEIMKRQVEELVRQYTPFGAGVRTEITEEDGVYTIGIQTAAPLETVNITVNLGVDGVLRDVNRTWEHREPYPWR